MLAYIPDGHTITAWVNEMLNLYPRVQFTYRPMTTSEVAEYVDAVGQMKEKEAQQLIAAHLASRISKWDVQDAKGQPAPLSEAVTVALNPRLSQRLWGIVSGREGPDGIVGQGKTDAKASFNAALEAARSGKPLAQAAEETQRKN